MDCCKPSRRQALMWGSLAAAAAATPLALTGAAPASASASDVLVIDLEVATVTDTSVVITWFTGSSTETAEYGFPAPVATDTVLQLGSADLTTLTLVPGTLKTVLDDPAPTAYHYAEVTGLQPDTPYYYAAMSNGQTAQQTSMQFPVGVGGSLDYPGIFSTLATPPGSYLFTLALSNDLHMGEGESGIIENNWPPYFEQDPGLPGYPVVMLEAMLGDLRKPDRRADRLIVAGDLTSSAELSQAQQVRQMLDGWGTIQQDYFVARGNHDRSMVGSTYAACTPVPNTSPQHYDCWGDVFPYPLQTLQTYDVGGLRLIGLDTTMLDLAGGTMSTAQLSALGNILASDRTGLRCCMGTTRSPMNPRPPPRRALVRHRPAYGDCAAAVVRQHARRLLPPLRPHPSQQADVPARRQPVANPVGRVPRGRGDEGVSRRLLAAASVHRRLHGQLLQEPHPAGAGLGAAQPARVLLALPALHAGHHRRSQSHSDSRPVGSAAIAVRQSIRLSRSARSVWQARLFRTRANGHSGMIP